MSDSILENNDAQLILASETKSMALWSETKRDEFVDTFTKRANAAAMILILTADTIWERAANRKFVGGKHYSKVKRVCLEYGQKYDRNYNELKEIAEQRAAEILKNLPPLKQAVQVIDPDTAKLIDERDTLQADMQVKKDKLDDLSEIVSLDELDQKMTIGDFRKLVKSRQREKSDLLHELTQDGYRLQGLEETITKRLYSGIPGLSDSIVTVINEHYERVTALLALNRRVAERVKFGDSAEALTLLEHFEHDEVKVSEKVGAEFAKALDILNVSKKQLKKGKSKK